jgi:hypothetical protein
VHANPPPPCLSLGPADFLGVNTKRFDKPNAASGDAEGYQRAANGAGRI